MLKYKPEPLPCATGNQPSGPRLSWWRERAASALSSQRDTDSPSAITAMSARTHRASAISGDRTNDAETGVACTIVRVSRLPSSAVLTVSSTVKAARLLAGSLAGAREVWIRYRSQYRPEVAEHPLIVDNERQGPVLRFRSATGNNEMIAKPVGISEADLYAAIEDAVSKSLTLIHSWSAGELLLVDNHTMLHSRAPFVGLRHMLRFRYDDPLHQAVIIAGCDT